MKPIKTKDLKVGDWIAWEGIFSHINVYNEIEKQQTFAKIIKITQNKYNNFDYQIRTYTQTGRRITVGGIIGQNEPIYLLNKEEIVNLTKHLILLNLNENKSD